jgi:hypothetical protein
MKHHWPTRREFEEQELHDARTRRFVTASEVVQIPNPAGFGRTLRIVVDIDMNAVYEYVMYEGRDGAPWPQKVLGEILSTFADVAHTEETIRAWLDLRRTEETMRTWLDLSSGDSK